MSEIKYRIGPATGWLMISFAAFFDVLEIILVYFGIGLVSQIITTPLAYGTLWLLFGINGIHFLKNPKMLKIFGYGALANIIPGMPAIAASTWYHIKISRKEDKERARKKRDIRRIKFVLGHEERLRAEESFNSRGLPITHTDRQTAPPSTRLTPLRTRAGGDTQIPKGRGSV